MCTGLFRMNYTIRTAIRRCRSINRQIICEWLRFTQKKIKEIMTAMTVPSIGSAEKNTHKKENFAK